MQKSADAFRTISEVADDLSLPQHVLRFWETRFPQIRPLKRAGGRRYYRPADVLLLRAIRQLLYDDGYTIKGVQRLIKEQGARSLGTADVVDRVGPVPDDLDSDRLDQGDKRDRSESVHDDENEAPGAMPEAPALDRTMLEQALADIEACTRILDAVRRT